MQIGIKFRLHIDQISQIRDFSSFTLMSLKDHKNTFRYQKNTHHMPSEIYLSGVCSLLCKQHVGYAPLLACHCHASRGRIPTSVTQSSKADAALSKVIAALGKTESI